MHIHFPLLPHPITANSHPDYCQMSWGKWTRLFDSHFFRYNQDWIHFIVKVRRRLHLNAALLFLVYTFWSCCHSLPLYLLQRSYFFGNWFYDLAYMWILTWKHYAWFVLFHFQGPNSVMIVLVMLLNIGLAILFVHFLTWLELGKVRIALISI